MSVKGCFFSLWKLSKNIGGLSLPLLWIFSGMMCLVVGLDVVFPLSVSRRSSMEGDKMKCCGDGFTGRPECGWQAVMCSCMMASQVSGVCLTSVSGTHCGVKGTVTFYGMFLLCFAISQGLTLSNLQICVYFIMEIQLSHLNFWTHPGERT